MTHEINKQWLVDEGWVEVEGGWIPAELEGIPYMHPKPLEEALGMARWLEAERKRYGSEL